MRDGARSLMKEKLGKPLQEFVGKPLQEFVGKPLQQVGGQIQAGIQQGVDKILENEQVKKIRKRLPPRRCSRSTWDDLRLSP
eukprot:tig00001718_g9589.t1